MFARLREAWGLILFWGAFAASMVFFVWYSASAVNATVLATVISKETEETPVIVPWGKPIPLIVNAGTTYKVTVALPDGIQARVSVTKKKYEQLQKGDTISVTVRTYFNNMKEVSAK